jgi:hypothetical protein
MLLYFWELKAMHNAQRQNAHPLAIEQEASIGIKNQKTFRWTITIKSILQINAIWFDKCINNFARIITCDFSNCI